MTDNPLVEAVGEAIFNVDVGNTSSDDERHYHVTLYNHQTKEDEVIATYDYSYGVANSLELHVKHEKEQRALAALRAIEDAGYRIEKADPAMQSTKSPYASPDLANAPVADRSL